MTYLTKEEVEKLNRGEVPAAQYMKGTLEWNEDYNYYWVPSTGSWVIKERKVKPQDTPAVCNYSGLRPVEGYKEEEKDKEDIDKEIKIEAGDIDFMYKWIRSKSGK